MIEVPCTCGRSDDWHRPECKTLTAPILIAKSDGNQRVYQNNYVEKE